jgi:hypothetical protein
MNSTIFAFGGELLRRIVIYEHVFAGQTTTANFAIEIAHANQYPEHKSSFIRLSPFVPYLFRYRLSLMDASVNELPLGL